jgi:hypothetical protein
MGVITFGAATMSLFSWETMSALRISSPHNVVGINDRPIIGINRSSTGDISLVVDMRDSHNNIILRLNENGFRSINNIAVLRPDKSTVLFEDGSGNELFRARYINPHVFALSGYLVSEGKEMPLQMPNIHHSCMAYSGHFDYDITLR